MTIYVSGEFNTWDKKKRYNIDFYGVDEIILEKMEKYLRTETEKAMKDERLEDARELLEATILMKERSVEAKKNADEQMEEYLKENEENGDVE